MERSLACPSRIDFLPHFWSSSIGFTALKTQIVCLLLTLLPPGINPFLIVEYVSLPFPTWKKYKLKSSGISTHCLAVQDTNEKTSWMSLNCSEVREVLGKIGNQEKLKPFLWSSSLCQRSYQIVNWPLRSTIELRLEFFHDIVISYCSTIFRKKLMDHVGVIWSCLLALQNNLVGTSQDWGLSISFHDEEKQWETVSQQASFVALLFATNFSVTLCLTFPNGMISDVSVTYLLVLFTFRMEETVLSRKSFDHDFKPVTSLMKPDLPPKTGPISCFWESTLSLRMLLHLEVTCTLDTDSPFHQIQLNQM